MARPVCTSLDAPPAVVDGTKVWVHNQNWRQGEGQGDPLNAPHYIKRWRIGTGYWNVEPPPSSQDLPAPALPGEDIDSFDFAGVVPVGTTLVLFQVFASTDSHYAGAYDKREWGGTFNVTNQPVEFSVVVTKGAVPADPPLDELREGVAQLKSSYAYRAHFTNVVAGTNKCDDALTRLGG